MTSTDPAEVISDLGSSSDERRRNAAKQLCDWAEGHAGGLHDHRDALLAAVEDDDPLVRGHALVGAYYTVAGGELLEPAPELETILSCLTDDDEGVRQTLLGLLAPVELKHGLTDRDRELLGAGLIDCLDSDSAIVRSRASDVLESEFVTAHPEPERAISVLVGRLETNNRDDVLPVNSRWAPRVVPALAREYPDQFTGYIEPLQALLESDDSDQRRIAALTLAALTDDPAVDPESIAGVLRTQLLADSGVKPRQMTDAMADFGSTDSQSAAAAIDCLRPALLSLQSEDRKRVAGALARIAAEQPESCSPPLRDLTAGLAADAIRVESDPLHTLAREHPAFLVDTIEIGLEHAGEAALHRWVVTEIVEENPDIVPDIASLLEQALTEDELDPGPLLKTIASLASDHPEQILSLLPAMIGALDVKDEYAQRRALETLSDLAAGNPDLVADVIGNAGGLYSLPDSQGRNSVAVAELRATLLSELAPDTIASADADVLRGLALPLPLVSGLEDRTIVLTGSFDGFTRDELIELVEANGGRVTSSVSSTTDVLFVGSDTGDRKLTDAREHDTTMASEEALFSVLALAGCDVPIDRPSGVRDEGPSEVTDEHSEVTDEKGGGVIAAIANRLFDSDDE